MPTDQDMKASFEDAMSGSDDPGVLVLPLRLLRQLSPARPRRDIAEFLRANDTQDENLLVQLTLFSVQFV